MKLSLLNVGKPYLVTDFRRVNTKYGSKLVVELENSFICFLPQRYNERLRNEDPQLMLDSQYYMFYNGTEHSEKYPLVKLEFLKVSGKLKI